MFKITSSISLDTETTGVLPWRSPGHPLGDRPFAVSMCNDEGNTWYTEWPVNPFTREVSPNQKDLRYIDSILTNEKVRKKFFNAKFDLRMLERFGVSFKGRIEEVYFMAKMCNSQEGEETAGRGGYGLKRLAKKYANISDEDQKTLATLVAKARTYGRKMGWKVCTWGKKPAFADYWMPRLAFPGDSSCEQYACLDAVRTYVLCDMYEAVLDEDEQQRESYEREMEAWYGIWDAESWGVHINRKVNRRLLREARAVKEKYLQKMRETLGDPNFNPGSPDQLEKVLYDRFELPCTRRNKPSKKKPEGSRSTDIEALKPLTYHPFVQDLQIWRSSDKSENTFHRKYDILMVPEGTSTDPNYILKYCKVGKDQCELISLPESGEAYILHPCINQVEAVTGRTSANDPNLQQVADASKTVKGSNPIQARTPFGPRPGYNWYGYDWSQQEARIFADIAQVPFMLEAIRSGRDVNTEMANRAWGGANNPAAPQAMAFALELGRDKPSTEQVEEARRLIGWTAEHSKYGLNSPPAIDAADRYLRRFDYDITAAELSLGKVSSRGRAKMVLFSQMYGGGPKAVVNLLYVDFETAKQWVHDFHRQIPEVKQFQKKIIGQAMREGYIRTAYGRKITIDPEFAYKCVDYAVQGTAADMLKVTILKTRKYFYECKVDAHFILPVHDEALYEINRRHASMPLLRGIKRIMEETDGRLSVPMKVECYRVTERWDQPKKGVL